MNGSSPEFLPAWLRAAFTKHFAGSKLFDFLVEYTVNRDFERNFQREKKILNLTQSLILVISVVEMGVVSPLVARPLAYQPWITAKTQAQGTRHTLN